MVAVNRRFTLVALSLASLSLTDAAAIHARSSPSDPGSPSKHARQQAPTIPMPMKRMVAPDSPSKRERRDDMSKRSKFNKSRVVEANSPLGKAFSRRQQEQARFNIKNSPRKHVEAREESSGTPGHVDIKDSATNTTKGHLQLDASHTPPTLAASQSQVPTTLYLVPSDSNHYNLRVPIFNATTNTTDCRCATFDPAPKEAKPLFVEDCSNSTTQHKSQTFLYDSTSGVIQPMWSNDTSAGSDSSATLNSRGATQDVMLVFVQDAATSEAQEQEVSPDSDSTSVSASAAKETETITTTVTATASPSFAVAEVAPASSTSAASSQSMSVSADQFLSSTSSDVFPSPSFAAAEVDPASSTTTDPLSQPTSSSSVTASSLAPASSSADSRVGALAVEVAAPSSSSAISSTLSSYSSVSSAPSSYSSVPSASSSASSVVPSATLSTVNAAALAADIVASNASSSASTTATSSPSMSASASSASASPSVAPPIGDEQAVYVGAPHAGPAAEWRRWWA